MKIKTVTFAVTTLILIALGVVVLWFYHTDINPILVAAGPKGAATSSMFQTIFLLAVLGAGILLLFFIETWVFRPVAKAGRTLATLLSRGDETLSPGSFQFGMHGDLSSTMAALAEDVWKNDALLTERQNHLNHRLLVEEALAKVSRNLLRDREKGIARSLRTLGRNLNTDVVSYWELGKQSEFMHCIGTFRDAETGEFSGEYDFCAPVAPWISDAIHLETPLIIDDVNNIPEEMQAVKQFISEYELKSFLGVPLKVIDSDLGGMVAFGNIQAVRHWSKEDLRALEVVAELFTDHIGRQSFHEDGKHCEA